MARRLYKSFVDDSSRWDRIVLRDGDIVIDTPAKSGTTWMQLCVALLIFDSPEPPRPMAELSPWIDMLTWPIDELVAVLEAQEHRRFVKSHTPLDGLPMDPRVTYVCVGRDPRDAMLSMENHMANTNFEALLEARANAVGLDDLDPSMMRTPPPDDPVERFRHWVDEPRSESEVPWDLAGVLHHLTTFWERREEPNIALFHYADLQADLPGQLRRLAEVLAIEIAGDRVDELATAATFDAMKARADQLAPDTMHGIWRDTREFFHHGRSGRWREIVGDDDVAHYEARVASLVPPDLAHWAHHGWLGA